MITKEQVDKAWKEWNDYKEKHFGGPGNGCDDYRDIPDEVFRKKRELEDKARKLQMEYDEAQHYVPNDVFQFRLNLKRDLGEFEIPIYVKPFPDIWDKDFDESKYISPEDQEQIVQDKYFTQRKIDELKLKLIQRIQECKNPFDIFCYDTDGGYNVTKDQLFSLD